MIVERRKNELAHAPRGTPCTIEFEGKRLIASEGEPLTVTLLAHGIETASRSVKYHRPRGPFCLAGICGQCWMRIDDLPNRAACLERAREGRVVTRENAFPSADFDVLRATDHLFAEGLDHHRLGTTPIRPLNAIMQDTARRLAGLGTLSSKRPGPPPPLTRVSVDTAVIGAGPAGLSAARAAASGRGGKTLLIESRDRAGGQIRTKLYDDVPELRELPARSEAEIRDHGGALWTSSTACGIYGDQSPNRWVILVRRRGGSAVEQLSLVQARTLILAPGGYEEAPLFESNDLPGHFGARALAELVLAHGVLPGDRVVIFDGGAEAGERLHRRLRALGVTVVRVVASGPAPPDGDLCVGTIVAARGGTHVKGVEIGGPRGASGRDRIRIPCNVIASATPVAPSFELGRQAGCDIEHRPEAGGFAVTTDPATGRTSIEDIYAAGDVTGAKSAALAAIEGEIAGLSAALRTKDDAALRARREELAEILARETDPRRGASPP